MHTNQRGRGFDAPQLAKAGDFPEKIWISCPIGRIPMHIHLHIHLGYDNLGTMADTIQRAAAPRRESAMTKTNITKSFESEAIGRYEAALHTAAEAVTKAADFCSSPRTRPTRSRMP